MIIERTREQALLKDLLDSHDSKFLAVYGRRRVGKTYLISQFFNKPDIVYLEVMGLKKGSEQDHRDLFVEQIAEKLNESLYDTEAKSCPHPKKETDKGALMSVRRFLKEAGVNP